MCSTGNGAAPSTDRAHFYPLLKQPKRRPAGSYPDRFFFYFCFNLQDATGAPRVISTSECVVKYTFMTLERFSICISMSKVISMS